MDKKAPPMNFAVWRAVAIRCAIVASLLFVALLVGLAAANERTVSCGAPQYERASNPDATKTATMSKRVRRVFAFWIPRIVVIALSFYSAFVSRKRPILCIGGLTVMFVSYFPMLLAVEKAKKMMVDTACTLPTSTANNALSGHAFYFLWMTMTTYYVGKLLQRESHRDFSTARWAAVVIVFLCVSVEGVHTFLYGYHSVQQMLLGGCIGALYTAFSCGLSEVVILGGNEETVHNSLKPKAD